MKVALVHEFLNQFGGAERVLLALKKIFKEAPIYALLTDFEKLPPEFKNFEIRTSFLSKWPSFIRKRHKFLLPFYPLAVEQFDLSAFDLVISDSNSFAKGVLTKPETIHICYCHTPTAYLWHYSSEYLKEQRLSNISQTVVNQMLDKLRIWDRQAAQRPDYFIANSRNVQKRIKKYYHRNSEVIYPPVNIENLKIKSKNASCPQEQLKTKNYFERQREKRFLSEMKGSYFLIVSRLSPYKKIDLAVKVFNKLREDLIIIGEGSELKRLKKMARSNIRFLGFQPDEKVKEYYKTCRALIFPGEEDFGIVPVEAMSYEKSVIAYKKGGVLETILEEKTGVFFSQPTVDSLLDAIKRFVEIENNFEPQRIRKQAEKFNRKVFQDKIEGFVKKCLKSKSWE